MYPHPGNFLLNAQGEIIVLDFGCVRAVEPAFATGLLDLADALWRHDHRGMARVYARLGFGREQKVERFDPELLREYHELVLRPLYFNGAFDFGSWRVHGQLNRFMLRHPTMVRLAPPAAGIMPIRVMGGIKGLLTKMEATFNIHELILELVRKRGRLSTEPRYDAEGWVL